MTDTKVAQLSALLQGMQNMSSTADKTQKTEAVFGALLSQTASSGYEQQYSWTQDIGKNSVSAESNQIVYEKESAQTSYKDTSFVKESSNDIASKLPEDAKEQLEGLETGLKEVLEEKLGVSEEELLQVMEQLGITMWDLSNPAKLAQLVMELTGSTDGSELLLNSDFQSLMTQVQEMFGQLEKGLNLTPEEFQQLTEQLAKMQQNETAEQIPDVNADIEEGTVLPSEDKQTDNGIQTQDKQTASKDVKPEQNAVAEEKAVLEETPQTDKTAGKESGEQTAVKQVENAEKQMGEESGEQTGGQKSEMSQTTVKAEPGTNQQPSVSYQTTTETIIQGQNVEVVQTVTQSQIDVENILRQISQMTRISVTQSQSSIEMQLNPENLGKVYLQVVSKEGAITAQIAAQNEAVKEVLESQIAILKENMNQQGMKVEAIEVTVASHEFERNLEENQQNPEKEQPEMEKTVRRGINLNNLDELEGLMSEEESLAAKIMQENGNSVDLTA